MAEKEVISSSRPLLIVLSGPSGTGKDVLLSHMKNSEPSLFYIVTLTTRPKRAGEVEGQDYHFVSSGRFQSLREKGKLLEWAEVYGNLYGVPEEPIRQALTEERDVVLKVDIQGAATIKRKLPGAVLIFIMPPSMEELCRRLKNRGTESAGELSLRMKKARQEMENLSFFDYIVVSHQDKIEFTLAQIKAIITAEKCRVKPRKLDPAGVLK